MKTFYLEVLDMMMEKKCLFLVSEVFNSGGRLCTGRLHSRRCGTNLLVPIEPV